MKKVSIIIPVYNVEDYLRECLDSVVSQTYNTLQIIIVDDGSTDRSGKICDEYAATDKRIRVIHQKNSGAANAKNIGLDNATGDYVAFIDSDDYVSENWIEIMINAVKEYNSDIVECGFDRIKTNSSEIRERFSSGEQFTVEEYLFQYIDHWESRIFWNKIFESKLLQNVRFRTERRCIDDEFFTYKVISNGKKVVRVGDILYHYRQRQSSAVHLKEHSLQITDDCLEYTFERFKWIEDHFSNLRNIYLKHDIHAMVYFSNRLTYNNLLIKKYKKIAWSYFARCFILFPDKLTWYYAFSSVIRRKKKYNTTVSFVKDQENLFK